MNYSFAEVDEDTVRKMVRELAAVGLGIILAFYRNKETVNIDEMNLMKW